MPTMMTFTMKMKMTRTMTNDENNVIGNNDNFNENNNQNTPKENWLSQRSDGFKIYEGGVGSGESIFSNLVQNKGSRS